MFSSSNRRAVKLSSIVAVDSVRREFSVSAAAVSLVVQVSVKNRAKSSTGYKGCWKTTPLLGCHSFQLGGCLEEPVGILDGIYLARSRENDNVSATVLTLYHGCSRFSIEHGDSQIASGHSTHTIRKTGRGGSRKESETRGTICEMHHACSATGRRQECAMLSKGHNSQTIDTAGRLVVES